MNSAFDFSKIRSPLIYATLAGLCVVLGLASRNPGFDWPVFFKAYGGDTLWAAMVFFAAGIIWKRQRTWTLAAGVALFSLTVELSQLSQAEWLNSVRDTRIGALILGRGFLWSDLLCYAVGVGLAAVVDWVIQRRRQPCYSVPVSSNGANVPE